MLVNQIIKTVKPLSNEALFKVAPSIFSRSEERRVGKEC